MAEGFLKSFDKNLVVFSAGTKPSSQVHPKAIQVMKEVGIDLISNYPKNSDRYINDSFDFVITVCDNAKESCPIFNGKVGQRVHIGFEDPAEAIGSDEEVLEVFRSVRDQIRRDFFHFYEKNLTEQPGGFE
ncbi:arsenate reductase [sediment metagenome]|uniref:Arsenate reductase n=1 Tax=sediment metagenome TaxID=749907 RepID=D9PGC9_9ZZZZ